MAAWDAIAPARAKVLDTRQDISYERVIIPQIEKLLTGSKADSILDIGCGTGRLIKRIAGNRRAVAIDPSPVSAQIANEHLGSSPNIEVHNVSAQEFARLGFSGFDIALAVMVLQDVTDMRGVLQAASQALRVGGRVIGCVTHPFYWPHYWGYDSAPWFEYNRELYIKSEFRTSRTRSGLPSLHVHRPLSRYVDEMTRSSFRVMSMPEPLLDRVDQDRSGVRWEFPHFLFFELEKMKGGRR